MWLDRLVECMRATMRAEYRAGMQSYEALPRSQWVFAQSAQTTITVSRTFYTHEVDSAFDAREDGNDGALRELHARLQGQLSELIGQLNGPLAPGDRKKLITLCTVDVHARDVVQRLVDERADSAHCLQWQGQLRYYQSPATKDCVVRSLCWMGFGVWMCSRMSGFAGG